VSLAEDNGARVSIAAGLEPTDRVILSLPVDLADGAKVAVRNTQTAAVAQAGG
jgi:hypothetical protein